MIINISMETIINRRKIIIEAMQKVEKAHFKGMETLQKADSTWNDDNYLKFKRIVTDSLNDLTTVYKILNDADYFLEMLQEKVHDYDLMFFNSSQSMHLSNAAYRHRESSYVSRICNQSHNTIGDYNAVIVAGLARIEKEMEIYRNSLYESGSADLESIENMVQQARDRAECNFYNEVFGDVKEECIKNLKALADYFNPENWKKMSRNKRKEVLIALAKSISTAFRIEIKGIIFFEGHTSLRGYYNHDGYLYMNDDVLTVDSNMEDALDTIFHEGRHAFQHAAINNPNFYSISRQQALLWEHNIHNYISYERNPYRYYNQPIEMDAREFAEGGIRSGIRE